MKKKIVLVFLSVMILFVREGQFLSAQEEDREWFDAIWSKLEPAISSQMPQQSFLPINCSDSNVLVSPRVNFPGDLVFQLSFPKDQYYQICFPQENPKYSIFYRKGDIMAYSLLQSPTSEVDRPINQLTSQVGAQGGRTVLKEWIYTEHPNVPNGSSYQWTIEGAERIEKTGQGGLRIKTTKTQQVFEVAPIEYWRKADLDDSELDFKKSRFAPLLLASFNKNEISFLISENPNQYPLLIDPSLAWGQWLGGDGSDVVNTVQVNGDEIYVGGYTVVSTSFESVTFQGQAEAQEGFVVEIADGGTPSLAWGQWLGGSSTESVYGISVNGDEIYASGYSTVSTAWESVTFQGQHQGTIEEGFVIEIADGGTPSLVWGQWLGGNSFSIIQKVVANDDEIYVWGYTDSSTSFEAVTLQGAHSGGFEAFVVEIADGDTPSLVWGQWLGGSGDDVSTALAVNGDEIYAGGYSLVSTQFESVPFQGTMAAREGFVIEIADGGTPSLSWGQWLGGNSTDVLESIAVNGDEIYAGGNAPVSTQFESVTFQGAHSGNQEGFVIEIADGGTPSLVWGQWLGGTSNDQVRAVAVNGDEIYAAGYSSASTSFEAISFQGTYSGGLEEFVVEIKDGATPSALWGQWLGGAGNDIYQADCLAANGNEIYPCVYSDITSSGMDGETITIEGTKVSDEGLVVELADLADLMVKGTVYTNEGVTPIAAGRTVRVKVNGSGEFTGMTNASGVFASEISITSAGDVITLFLDGAAEDGVTITRAADNTSDLTSINLYQNYIILRHEDAGPITNANLGQYDLNDDADIQFSSNSNQLVASASTILYVSSGTYTPGGDISGVQFKQIGGVTNVGVNTMTLSGAFTLTGGTFNVGSGTVDVNAASISQTGGTLDLGTGSIKTELNFTKTAGTYTTSTGQLIFNDASSSAAQDSTLTCAETLAGTVKLDKLDLSGTASDFTLASGGCIISLGTSAVSKAAIITNNGTINVGVGSWTVTNGDNDGLVNNGTLNVSATNWSISDGGIKNNSSGTITYAGSSLSMERNFTQNGTFDLTGKTVTFLNAGGGDNSTVSCSTTLGGTIGVNKVIGASSATFAVGAGCTINLGNSPSTVVEGNFTNNGTVLVPSGTWSHSSPDAANGIVNAGTITHSGQGWDVNDSSLTNNSGATINYSGSLITVDQNFTQRGDFDLTGKTVTLSTTGGSDASTVTCGTFNGTLQINKDNATGTNSPTIASGCTVNMGGGTTDVIDDTFTNNGTINVGAGSWVINNTSTSNFLDNGTVTAASGVWDFNDTGFGNLSGAGVTFPSGILYVERSFSNSGSLDSTVTVVMDDNNNAGDDANVSCSSAVGALTINKTNAGALTVLTGDCTVSGNFSRTNGIVSNPASPFNLNVGGDFSLLTSDAYGGASMTTNLTGTGTQTMTTAATISGPLVINKSPDTVATSTTFTISQNLSVVVGTFQTSGNITGAVGKIFLVNDGATFNLTGAATAYPAGFTLNLNGTTSFVKIDTSFSLAIPAGTYGHLEFGTVIADSGGTLYPLSAGTTRVQGNLTIGNPASVGADLLSLANNSILDVDGNVSITSQGYLVAHGSHPFTVGGNWTNNGTFASTGGTVTFDATSTGKTLTGDMSSPSAFYNVTFNGSGGGWTLGGDLVALNTMNVAVGTFDQGASYNVTVGVGTVGTSGSWLNTGTGDLTIGTTMTNDGKIHFDGSGEGCGGADAISIRSTSNGVQRSWNGSGKFLLMRDLDVKDQAGGVDINVYNSTNNGNNGSKWHITQTCEGAFMGFF